MSGVGSTTSMPLPARAPAPAPASRSAHVPASVPSIDVPALHRGVTFEPMHVPGQDEPTILQDPTVIRVASAVKRNAGDASSVLSMAGAVMLFAPRGPLCEVAKPVVAASIMAGAIDTVGNLQDWHNHKDGAGLGSTIYAATGLLPASSVLWATALKGGVQRHEVARLSALGANIALIGYEALHRGPDIADGKENTSGYLAVGAALSGVVAKAR